MQICLRNNIKDIHSTGKIFVQNVSNKITNETVCLFVFFFFGVFTFF